MALLLQRREGGMLLATPAEFWPDPQLVEAEEAGYPATIGPSIMDTMPLPTEADPEAFCEVLIIDRPCSISESGSRCQLQIY